MTRGIERLVTCCGEQLAERREGCEREMGDVDAFCRAVEQLADSEPLRRSFGDNARTFVRSRYSAATMIESYLQVLTPRGR